MYFSNHHISSYNTISYIVHICVYISWPCALGWFAVCLVEEESSKISFLQNRDRDSKSHVSRFHDSVVNNEHASEVELSLHQC